MHLFFLIKMVRTPKSTLGKSQKKKDHYVLVLMNNNNKFEMFNTKNVKRKKNQVFVNINKKEESGTVIESGN